MINRQLLDAIEEVENCAKELPPGSVEKMLMEEAQASIEVARSLVEVVNTMRFANLLNGDSA